MIRIICALILAVSATGAYAYDTSFSDRGSRYEGVLHNNSSERRASLDAFGKLYWLDFRGVDLSDVAERHDRERVIVHGTVSFSRSASRPVLFVDKITFRPYGRALTYDLNAPERYIQRRYYTTHREPYVKERTIVREYNYR
jgi:hypothetical protein